MPNGYYPVYIDQPRGHTQHCAWQSCGDVNGVTVQFGFFFDLDGDRGCDPQSPASTYSGAENSDKCAWTFGPASSAAASTGRARR